MCIKFLKDGQIILLEKNSVSFITIYFIPLDTFK